MDGIGALLCVRILDFRILATPADGVKISLLFTLSVCHLGRVFLPSLPGQGPNV